MRAFSVSFEDVEPKDKRQHLSPGSTWSHGFFHIYQRRAEDDEALSLGWGAHHLLEGAPYCVHGDHQLLKGIRPGAKGPMSLRAEKVALDRLSVSLI